MRHENVHYVDVKIPSTFLKLHALTHLKAQYITVQYPMQVSRSVKPSIVKADFMIRLVAPGASLRDVVGSRRPHPGFPTLRDVCGGG